MKSTYADALWASSFGQRLEAEEQELLQPFLRRLHGDAVLWVGENQSMPATLKYCMVRQRIWATRCGVSIAGDSCLLYTSPSPRDVEESRMPSSA